MGHGLRRQPTHALGDQRGACAHAMDEIEAFRSVSPRRWKSPDLTETEEKLDILREPGVAFVADRVIDDLPQEIATPHGPITAIPCTVDTNDITVHAVQGQASPVFLQRCVDAFDRLWAEGP